MPFRINPWIFARGAYCLVDIGGRPEHDLAYGFFRGRIDDGMQNAPIAGDPLTADIVFHIALHYQFLANRVSDQSRRQAECRTGLIGNPLCSLRSKWDKYDPPVVVSTVRGTIKT